MRNGMRKIVGARLQIMPENGLKFAEPPSASGKVRTF